MISIEGLKLNEVTLLHLSFLCYFCTFNLWIFNFDQKIKASIVFSLEYSAKCYYKSASLELQYDFYNKEHPNLLKKWSSLLFAEEYVEGGDSSLLKFSCICATQELVRTCQAGSQEGKSFWHSTWRNTTQYANKRVRDWDSLPRPDSLREGKASQPGIGVVI